MMNVFVGCFTWNAIWCGEKVNFLLFVTFNSTVKKPRFSVYPTRSGKPKDAQDSTRVHIIFGVCFLTFFHNLDSGFIGDPSKIRTYDPIIKSDLLYRLSYGIKIHKIVKIINL